jgi:hypothetical protein
MVNLLVSGAAFDTQDCNRDFLGPVHRISDDAAERAGEFLAPQPFAGLGVDCIEVSPDVAEAPGLRR